MITMMLMPMMVVMVMAVMVGVMVMLKTLFAKWWKLMKGLCCGSQADSAMRSTMKQKSTTMKI